jgi:4-aminobutyrate aminotransferase / (S)-3-amino-2-methylpropionate transaminase / 5-aminovalerate transaminase
MDGTGLAPGEQLPRMVTRPPGPKSRAFAAELIQHESPGVSSIATGTIPIFWEEALGSNVIDADGNRYLDMSAAFTVALAGHSNPRIVAAIAAQAQKLLHAQGAIHPSSIRLQLAKLLREVAPGELGKSIISNTGAEAIEVALKTAKLFKRCHGVIAFFGGFHGKTMGALAVTSRSSYKRAFGTSVSAGVTHVPYAYCYRCPFKMEHPGCGLACLQYLEFVLDHPASSLDETAALIVEPIQGHEGNIVPPDEFLPRLRSITASRGILLIADEIITGFGRTGAWFAVDHAAVVPDLITVAKGIASGFPVSAAIGKDAVMNAWEAKTGEASHSSTFLGNPVGCAAAVAGIAEIRDRDLVGQSRRMGEYLLKQLRAMQDRFEVIGHVHGKGLLLGAELVCDRASRKPASILAKAVGQAMLERGIIQNIGGLYNHVLKISPPLVITQRQVDHYLEVLAEVLDGCLKQGGPVQ